MITDARGVEREQGRDGRRERERRTEAVCGRKGETTKPCSVLHQNSGETACEML